jgi:hypothetical protein
VPARTQHEGLREHELQVPVALAETRLDLGYRDAHQGEHTGNRRPRSS